MRRKGKERDERNHRNERKKEKETEGRCSDDIRKRINKLHKEIIYFKKYL